MAVPYTFATATSAIPLSQLDSNFATAVTIGNVAIQLGNTATTLGNVTMANVTITSVSTPITGAQGGTGLSSSGTTGNVLVSNGTTWLSQAITATNMPTGSVIQVVQATQGSTVSSTSTTYANTNLSASITPQFSTSKILVLIHQAVNSVTGVAAGYGYQTDMGVQLLRGATLLTTPSADTGGAYSIGFGTGTAPSSGNIVLWGYVDFNYLDSPATTSSVTYSTQFRVGLSGMTAYVNPNTSFITLMEIR